MANGDIAAAAGLPVVPPTADIRLGYDEINKTRDQVATHMTVGTHTTTQVTGLDTALAAKAAVGHDHGNTVVKSYVGQDVRLRQDAARALWYVDGSEFELAKLSDIPAGSTNADGPTYAAYNRGATGSSWFQVWMNSSLQFMRNTSSRRFKKNIRAWAPSGSGVLGMRPVIFDRRGNDTPNDEVGFIAEEVLEVLPEAVVSFDGKVDGINDRTILTALVSLCQAQATQITDLTTRIETLEGGA